MLSKLMIAGAIALAATSAAAAVPAIPDRLHGQWTDDLSSCGREDVGGMRVDAGSVVFYESLGTPKAISEDKAGTITAAMAYTGEGKSWTETNRFTVSADRSSVRVDALGKAFTLKRCKSAAKAGNS